MRTNFSRLASLVGAAIVVLVITVTGRGAVQPVLADTALSAADFCVFLPIGLSANAGAAGGGAQSGVDCSTGIRVPDIVDFNGDGYADLAIGVPQDNRSILVKNSGAVNVLYGTADGLSSAEAELWIQTDAGSFAHAGDLFGTAVTADDFNGDGFTDLAIGSPGEDVNGLDSAGQVNVLYGSPAGLSAENAQVFSQGIDGIQGATEEDDQFGDELTSGDYNGDGYADLVVGVPYEDYEADGISNMGAVNVLYGAPGGLAIEGNEIVHPALPEVDGTPAWWGRFGYALETGDFDGDGLDDLAVGIPGYDLAGTSDVGIVEVFYGGDSKLSLVGEQLWRQGFNGVQGAPEDNDEFGSSLAAGDFDNNGADDLAIGVPLEGVAFEGVTYMNAGAVNVLYGYVAGDGLSSSGNQIWHQGLATVNGHPNTFDYFGGALVAADFNGDGADDLAVGVPGESVSQNAQGIVQVLYSNGSILSPTGQDLWLQEMVGGTADPLDFFGSALGTADFDGDGFADLAVGIGSEDIVIDAIDREDVGEISTIYGAANGLTAEGTQRWQQGDSGVPGLPEEKDHFGYSLTR